MKIQFYDFKMLYKFITRPASWLVILAAAIFITISTLIFVYGFDARMPNRLMCTNASNINMVIILISGFLFIVTSVAGVGSLFIIADNWLKKRKFNFHDLWLPLAALCLGILSFALQLKVCG
jgi:amino acid transporter